MLQQNPSSWHPCVTDHIGILITVLVTDHIDILITVCLSRYIDLLYEITDRNLVFNIFVPKKPEPIHFLQAM